MLTFLKIDTASYELQQTLKVYPNFKEWMLCRFEPGELKQFYHHDDFEIPMIEAITVYRHFRNEIWQIIRDYGSLFTKIDTLKMIAMDSFEVCDHEAFENFIVRYAIVRVVAKVTESSDI